MHRFLSFIVAGAIALAVCAAPAVASDGYSGHRRAENAPAAVVGTVPTGPPSFPQAGATQARTLAVAPSTAPHGAVAAGEGGSTDGGPGGLVFAIVAAGIVILAAGARLVVAARGSKS